MSNSRPVVVLVGLPGAGKSTVGAALAHRLDVTFCDVDSELEAQAGKPISEIFIDDGENFFREIERVAIKKALVEHDGVLAVGGGAILDATTRNLLAHHTVAYLQVGLSDAIKRVGLGAGRPVLALNPRATLRELDEQRRPFYQEVATFTVNTSDRPVADIVEELVGLLKENTA